MGDNNSSPLLATLRHLLRDRWKRLARHNKRVLASETAEPVHNLRVTTRRLLELTLLAADAELGVRDRFDGEPGRVRRQHLFGRVHQDQNARGEREVRDLGAKAERFFDFAAWTAVLGQDSTH